MSRLGRWLFTLMAVVALSGIALPADGQVVVRLGHRHHYHHHHYYHHHHHRYYHHY